MKLTKKIAAMAASAVLTVTSVAGSAFPVTNAAGDLELDNYAKLLQYSLYFYDANYCGVGTGEKSHFSWRDDCHTENVANGGFHDAGDGIICGLTEGFTASTLGWMYYEYKDEFQKTGTYAHLKDITDEFAQFFKNCTTLDDSGNVTNFIYEVGDDGADHGRWRAPELMPQRGNNEYYSTTNGASNVAAQYAAALAQNYINFGNEDDLKYAKALYEFAAKYRTMTYEQATYQDKSVEDDIAWAAGWMYLATKEQQYLDANSKDTSGTNDWVNDYYYGGVWLGAAIINAEITGNWDKPVNYIRGIVNANQNQFYIMNSWGSARHNTLMQTCALVASKYSESGADFNEWCQKQMNMILGENNANVCLVVGYNDVSATSPHHRAASGINEEYNWEAYNNWSGNYADSPNSHVLYGALCGGPTSTDFNTFRKFDAKDATSNEVALDYQVGLVGAAVGLYSAYGTGSVVAEIADEVEVYAEEIAVANGEKPNPPETTTTTETTITTTETTTTETTTETTSAETDVTTTTESSETETTTTTSNNSNIDVTIWGDANCDGKVTIADATAIIQALGNEDEYALSAQGAVNADVVDNGDGVTGADANAIQAIEAGFVKQTDFPMTKAQLDS
ncbi:MAG: glycoside hydrolase family 9 protein, partial [Ruminococcus sp.]|nr:glycoside hydrolase family 9 protein [Ruminococcus sp.]